MLSETFFGRYSETTNIPRATTLKSEYYVVVNLYLTRVILSEYFKVYLLSIGALIKLIYKYDKSLKIQNK